MHSGRGTCKKLLAGSYTGITRSLHIKFKLRWQNSCLLPGASLNITHGKVLSYSCLRQELVWNSTEELIIKRQQNSARHYSSCYCSPALQHLLCLPPLLETGSSKTFTHWVTFPAQPLQPSPFSINPEPQNILGLVLPHRN